MNKQGKIAQNTKSKRQAKKYAEMTNEVIYMMTEKYTRVVKVGYAKNFADRLAQYRTHSASFEILDVRYGTKADEKMYQAMLEEMGFIQHYDGAKTEWYDLPDTMPKATIRKGFAMFE